MCEDQLHPYCMQSLHEVLPAFLQWLMRKTGCSLEAEQHIEAKGQVSKRTSWSWNCGACGLLPGETHRLRPRDTLCQCGTFRLLHILQKGVLQAISRIEGSSKTTQPQLRKPQWNWERRDRGVLEFQKPQTLSFQSRVPLVLRVWSSWLF